MKNKSNADIICAIRGRLPESEQMASFLMDTLFLGKEAIYRRLRGEVAFTFEEVSILSSKLGFSIDAMAGLKQSERVLFDTALYKNHSPEDVYYNKLLDYFNLFSELLRSENVIGRFVNNHLPFIFSNYFETISKFRYYKWMHQRQGIDSNRAMAEVEVSPKILTVQAKWVEVMDRHKMSAIYIFDDNLFLSMCRDIEFYAKANLLNKKEIADLQQEMNNLIDFLESLTGTGVAPSGSPIQIYIMPFNLGANYMHFEYGSNSACYTHLHSIDHLRSYNQKVCDMQKTWIDQIKRYSVFITQSGEMLRLAYFKKQREHVANLG